MSSVKKWVVGALAGVAALGSVSAIAQARIRVDRQSQEVQTPTIAGTSGISYSQTGPSSSSLKVYTEGFLFCGNPGDAAAYPATLTTAHEDQDFSPAHPWTFFTATDMPTFGYNGGALVANPINPTSLTCLATTVKGAVASATREGVFDNGYDSPTEQNYSHLVNWIPPGGFSWMSPDWALVPTDPCASSVSQPAKVVEDVACAAVTGARPADDGAVRAATIWTATDGVSFTYLFRVDWRFGPQQPDALPVMQLPPAASDVEGSADALNVVVSDAFDAAFLDSHYRSCTLAQLPSVLDSSICSASQELNGNFSLKTTVSPPPIGAGFASFYVVITRPLGQSNHQLLTTPAVAVATLVERSVAEEGGDKFTGDDVVFGFMPSSTGFPWMSGQ